MPDSNLNDDLSSRLDEALRNHSIRDICENLSCGWQRLSPSSKDSLGRFINKHARIKGFSRDPLRAHQSVLRDTLIKIAMPSPELQTKLRYYWRETIKVAAQRAQRSLAQGGLELSEESVQAVVGSSDEIGKLSADEARLIVGLLKQDDSRQGATSPFKPPTREQERISRLTPRLQQWLDELGALPNSAEEWIELPGFIAKLERLNAQKACQKRLNDALIKLREIQDALGTVALSIADWSMENCLLEDIEQAIDLLGKYQAISEAYRSLRTSPPPPLSNEEVSYYKRLGEVVAETRRLHTELNQLLGPRSTPPDPSGNDGSLEPTTVEINIEEDTEANAPEGGPSMEPHHLEARAREPPCTDSTLDGRSSPLDCLEGTLREQIEHLDLLAELALTKETVDYVGAEIASLIRANRVAGATDLLKQRFPCAFAAFMAGEGIYHYKGGDFWSGVAAVVGAEVSAIRDLWGGFFEHFIQEHGLPRIPAGVGHRFVSTILLHSGIPIDSLNSFFDDFLSEVMANPQLDDMPIEDRIMEWLEVGTARHRAAQPVVRFLCEGGDYARDFADRCRAMALFALENKTYPTPAEVGLPARIIQHFQTWRESSPDTPSRKPDNAYYRRPVITVDPWSDGMLIDLPSQRLATGINPDEIRWAIVAGPDAITLPAATRYGDESILTEAMQARIPQPSETFLISLLSDDCHLRDWEYAGLSPDHLLLAFDPSTGELIPWSSSLPARELWLLIPSNVAIAAPDARRLAVFGALSGAWHGYHVEAWDLRSATTIQVGSKTFPVEPDPRSLRPYLFGGEILQTLEGGLSPLVYIGMAPDVVIPFAPGRDWQAEADRWRISIRNDTINQLSGTPLRDLTRSLIVEGDAMRLQLSTLEGLGAEAFGSCAITLSGPLGRDARFTFCIVPILDVPTLGNVRVSDERGRMAALSFGIRTDRRLSIESAESNVQVTAEEDDYYNVQGPADRTSVAICVRSIDNPSNTGVLLELPTPQLNWTIVDETEPMPTDWTAKVIRKDKEWLQGPHAPRLLVTTRPSIGLASSLRGSLILHDGTGESIRELAPRGSTRRWLSFRLDEIADDLRQLSSPLVAFELKLDGLPGHPSPIKLRLLEIQNALPIADIYISCATQGADHWSLELGWPEGQLPPSPSLRLWPISRPWEKPFVRELPGREATSSTLTIPRSDLPPGLYRSEIAKIDRWSSIEKLRPLRDAPGAVDIWIGSPDECRRDLARLAKRRDDEDSLRCRLALVLIDDAPPELDQLIKEISGSFHIDDPRAWFDVLMYLVEEGERRAILHSLIGQLLRRASGYRDDLFLEAFGRGQEADEGDQLRIEAVIDRIDPNLSAILRKIRRDGVLDVGDLRKIAPIGANDVYLDDLSSRLQDQGMAIRGLKADEQEEDELFKGSSVEEEPTRDLPSNFNLYLSDIGRVALLTKAQERELAETIRDGQHAQRELSEHRELGAANQAYLRGLINEAEKARRHFVEANLRLVVSIARKYLNRGMSMDDLVQEGNIGLMRAIEKYDPDRGFKFSTYATWWIRQGITRAIADQSRLIRVPVHAWEEHTRLARMRHQLTAQLGHEPSDAELATALSLPVGRVRHFRILLAQVVSLDESVGEGGTSTLRDLLPDESSDDIDEGVRQRELRDAIDEVLAGLKPAQQRVLRLRFGLDTGQARTLAAVGQELGLTRERVRQIEAKGLAKLREPSPRRYLKDFANFRTGDKANSTKDGGCELSTSH